MQRTSQVADLFIEVKPNARKSKIRLISDEKIILEIQAPARDGEANEELIRFLSEVLGIKKSSIEILRGQSGRKKKVRINGISKSEVLEKYQLSFESH